METGWDETDGWNNPIWSSPEDFDPDKYFQKMRWDRMDGSSTPDFTQIDVFYSGAVSRNMVNPIGNAKRWADKWKALPVPETAMSWYVAGFSPEDAVWWRTESHYGESVTPEKASSVTSDGIGREFLETVPLHLLSQNLHDSLDGRIVQGLLIYLRGGEIPPRHVDLILEMTRDLIRSDRQRFPQIGEIRRLSSALVKLDQKLGSMEIPDPEFSHRTHTDWIMVNMFWTCGILGPEYSYSGRDKDNGRHSYRDRSRFFVHSIVSLVNSITTKEQLSTFVHLSEPNLMVYVNFYTEMILSDAPPEWIKSWLDNSVREEIEWWDEKSPINFWGDISAIYLCNEIGLDRKFLESTGLPDKRWTGALDIRWAGNPGLMELFEKLRDGIVDLQLLDIVLTGTKPSDWSPTDGINLDGLGRIYRALEDAYDRLDDNRGQWSNARDILNNCVVHATSDQTCSSIEDRIGQINTAKELEHLSLLTGNEKFWNQYGRPRSILGIVKSWSNGA